MSKKILILAILSFVVYINGISFAEPVITYAKSYTADWVIALTDANDLLQTNLASYSATGNYNQWNWSPLGAAAFTDGQFFVWPSQFATWTNNAVLEYYLDTRDPHDPNKINYGYTITNIVTYGGWNDSGRDAQQYSIYYSVAGDPNLNPSVNDWILFDSVDYNPTAPGSPSLSRISWSMNLANVDAIRFVAPASVENGSTGLCEIDVIGTPTNGVAPIVDIVNSISSVWLDGGIVEVPLDGTVISPFAYTVLWSVDSQPAGSVVVFTPATANVEDVVVRFDMPGTYKLKLTADNGLTSFATATVTVYEDECAYAQAQPGFAWVVGDINYDCEVNLEDFVALAANWMECYHVDCP